MGRYRCPSCATVVEAEDPTRLVCPTCGFGDPSRTGEPAPQAPAPAAPQYNPYAGGGAQAPPSYAAGSGSYTYQPPTAPTGQQPGYGYGQGQPLRTPGQSVAALVFGLVAILGMCLFFVPFVGGFIGLISGILAIVFGTQGIKEANQNPTQVGGKGMAVTGLVLGIISLVLSALGLLMMLFFAALFGEFQDFLVPIV